MSYLVFHHSIRIRLKSDSLDEKKDEKAPVADTSTSTPSIPSAESGGEDESEDELTSKGSRLKEKTGALMGKINNLVTTDATTLQSSWQLVETRESPIVSCILYA